MGSRHCGLSICWRSGHSSDLPQLADDLARIASAAATLRSLIATGLSVGLMPFDVHPKPIEAHSKDPSGETAPFWWSTMIATTARCWSAGLTRDGYRVSVAASGREALSIVGGQAIDLVLLDMMMPDMDGLEVLAAMQTGSRPPNDLPS